MRTSVVLVPECVSTYAPPARDPRPVRVLVRKRQFPSEGVVMTNKRYEPEEPVGDVTSDPARDDRTGSDWSTEGGATQQGSATDTDQDGNSEDKGDTAALAGILPLIIMSVIAILVVVWLFAH